jgi:hypothetical protein
VTYRGTGLAKKQIVEIPAKSAYDHGRDRAANYLMLIVAAIAA